MLIIFDWRREDAPGNYCCVLACFSVIEGRIPPKILGRIIDTREGTKIDGRERGLTDYGAILEET